MIYHVYYTGLVTVPKNDAQLANTLDELHVKMMGQDQRAMLARLIRETKGNTFVFIVTNDQQEGFLRHFIDKEKLRDFITFEMKQAVTNGNYLTQGRKLWMYVLKTKE